MTIKAEVLLALAKSTEPLTAAQILDECESAQAVDQIAQNLSVLKGERVVEHAGKTEPGDGHRVLMWRLTATGRDVVKDIESATPATPRAKPKARRKAKKTKPAQRKQRKPARAVRKNPKPAPAIAVETVAPSRWAFTADKSLVLIGSTIEIERAAIRPLISFLKQLDEMLVLEAA